ncbi:MAG: alpha/beta hydrolase-fold protein [Anaerolineae bacterium]
MNKVLKRAQQEGTPLIDGDMVTFVWQGKKAPSLQADFSNWDEKPIALTKAAPGIWMHSVTLPSDAYIEYAYFDGDERVVDPHNKNLITNGMGKMNHWFDMPTAQHTTLVRRKANVPRGLVTQHRLDGAYLIAGGNRPVYLYHPPTDEPVPLLFVLDGDDYYKRAKLTTIVDNLIAQKRIPPIALAMPQHGGQARFLEYMCSDSTLGFLMLFVLPLAQQHLNLIDIAKNPGTYGIVGASMGGLMALYAGLRMPEVFGHVISQSGAFAFDVNERQTVIYDLVRNLPPRSLKLWMDVGVYEYLLPFNRRMRGELEERGYTVGYHEYNGGHNYTAWRDELAQGLEAIFSS